MTKTPGSSGAAAVVTVLRKELVDAGRDRRTWITALLSALVIGPGVMILLAGFLSDLDQRATRREVVVAGAENGPTLINFLKRRGATVVAAEPAYAARVAAGSLRNAVIVVPDDFEARLARDEAPRVEVVFDGTNSQARGAVDTAIRLLEGFDRELTVQRSLARGTSGPLIGAIDIERHDLATARAHGVQLLAMIPWLVLTIAAVGAVPMAIDVAAGERERGSLEPLLSNPIDPGAIVTGKWLAVLTASLAVTAATLAAYCVSLRLVQNDRLAALLQFGAPEALRFFLVLAPYCALMSALMLLVATWGRSFREAQTYVSQLILAVNLIPIAKLLLDYRDLSWQLPLPVLGQLMVMTRVLRGDPIDAVDIALPAASCLAAALLCLFALRRLLASERIVFGR
jgi:sodium transport system permease protein